MIKRKELQYLAIGLALCSLAFGLLAGIITGPRPAAAAQKAGPSSSVLPRTETLVVRLYFHDVFERDRLATEWGADESATTGGYLTVWTDRTIYNQMLAKGLRAEIDQAMTQQANNPNLFGQNSPDTFYGGYKTVEEMQTFLDQMVTNYPNLAEKIDIGDSWCKSHPGVCTNPAPTWNGYDLLVLHITNRSISGTKPVFWYDTGIHSREIGTPEVSMRYISWLLDNYNTNADAHWLVDYQDIWIMPMVNPDGHHMVEAGGNNPYLQRKNGDRNNGCTTFPPGSGQLGTDLNRNFPQFWGCCGGSSGTACNETYRGPSAASEDETQAVTNKIRTLIADQRGPNTNDPAPITTTGIIQSMHSYAALNLFPWGWTTTHSANDADLRNIGAHMSAPNAGGNGYNYGQPPEVLYAVDGDSGTWGYGELGAPSYTTELGPPGAGFFPAYSTIPARFAENQGMLTYMAKLARTPYLTTRGPDANTVAATPMTVTAGTPSLLTGSINYAWTGNTYAQNVADAEYYIDTPPWAGGTALPMTGTYNSQTVAVQASVDTTSLSAGRHILFVRGRGVNSYSGNLSWGPISATFLDVIVQGTPTPSVTGTPPTATRTVTPPAATTTPTFTVLAGTPTPTPCGPTVWATVAPLPVLKARAVGVSTSSAIYLFGGRPDNTTYTTDIYRYDLAGNSWSLLSTVLPDSQTSNMAGGLLTFPEGQRIFIAGGSGTGSTFTGRTLTFNPSDNTLAIKAAWPATPLRLPGGWTVYNNKFYIFGGIDTTASGTGYADNWVYDPMTNVWTQLPNNLSLARGYIAVEALGNRIYIAGGSQNMAGSLTDETTLDIFDPATNAITTGAALPTAKSNNQGYAFNGQFLVVGGAFTLPEALVYAYNPAANSWSTGPTLVSAARNYAKGYGTSGSIHAIGGLDDTGSYINLNQRLSAGACGTPTPGVSPTNTVVAASPTPTAPPTVAATQTATATPQPTACTIAFNDVPVGSTFYDYVRCLACRGIVGGYPCGGPGEPCPGNYYRPNNNVTRGQVSKIVSESAGFTDAVPSTQQTFQDVAPSSTFWLFIERLSVRGIIGGYPCGGAGEPCVSPTNRPYFRPNNNVTRGQLSKITSGAAGWTETPTSQTFEDVAPGSTFYVYIERMSARGIIQGYACGNAGEPCVAPGNRPYFRPNNNATRGQMAKIAAAAFFPNCATPARQR